MILISANLSIFRSEIRMKPIGVKPLHISIAALKRNIRNYRGGGYEAVPVLSLPRMLYHNAAEIGMSGAKAFSFNITLRRSESVFRLAAQYRAGSFYNERRELRRLGYWFGGLFKSYAGLSQLVQALWSIYKSNNLRLSQSLLTLIQTINEKNGAELGAYFEGLPNILRIQKKTVNALKRIDSSIFRQIPSIYGNSTVLNIGRREIRRHTDTVRRYGRTVSEMFRFTENIYTMTPLLTRIYEGIEAGVYFYSADSYRSAKTLQRLTNSLWKVYIGQNMEISRSFAKLIMRVNRENKTIELRNAENNMFSDNRSLKNLVNALRKAFSGSNLELRSSMISLFGDIHNAGKRKSVSINKYRSQRICVGITLLHREIIPEPKHTRLEHKGTTKVDRQSQTTDLSRLERDIKTKLSRFETAALPAQSESSVKDIVKEVLEQVNKKQQLDWRLEKLQRGIF